MSTPSESLSTIFTKGKYYVPDYQRLYTWTAREIDHFSNDIFDFCDNQVSDDQKYLLGQIIINRVTRKNDDDTSTTKLYVVDGQQRLATSTIFACILYSRLKKFDEDSHPEYAICRNNLEGIIGFEKSGYKLTMNSLNKDFFHHYVQKMETNYECTPVNKRILDAYVLLGKSIDEYTEDNIQTLIKLINCFTEQLELSVLETNDEKWAFTLFERLNTRGKPLVLADLLKNFVFSKIDHTSKDLETKWSNMIIELGKIGIDDPSSYIRYYWNSFNGNTAEGKIYEKVVGYYNEKGSNSFFDLIRNICDNVGIYCKLSDPDYNSTKFDTRAVEHIRLLVANGQRTYIPLILALVLKNESTSSVDRVLSNIVRLAVRCAVCHSNPNKLETKYSELAKKYTEGKDSIKDICSAIQIMVPNDLALKDAFSTFTIKDNDLAKLYLKTMYAFNYGDGELIVSTDGKEIQLEHIMPKSNRRWKVDKDIHGNYLYRFGNMTLLKRLPNQKNGDLEFDLKKKEYASSRILYTNRLIKYERWDVESIEKNQSDYYEDFIKTWPETETNDSEGE